MSDDFERFMRSARSSGSPTGEDARRVERKLSAKVSWNRALPLAVAAAFRSASAHAFAQSRFGLGPNAWTKIVGLTAAIGIVSGGSYFIATRSSAERAADVGNMQVEPAASISAASHSADVGTPAPAISAAAEQEPAAQTADAGWLVVDDPAKLPVAKPQAATSAPRTGGAAPAQAAGAASAPSLDAELALLAQTSAALRAHDPNRALALVATHDKSFPNGALGPEFAAQRVLSLAALGRRAEACSEARRFLAKNPNSPLAPQVRATCDETSSP